jgi:C1A family cysteine protease
MLEADYPYTAKSSFSCKYNKQKVAFNISGHKDVQKTNAAHKAALAVQPVAISIDAERIMSYHSGIFNDPNCGSSLDHAVLAVGYGVDGSHKFWKVKNSWGTSWGEQGYIRFERYDDQNSMVCGMLLGSSIPIA